MTVATQDVDAAFFDTLRIPILSGRAFTDRDRAGMQAVAIVNETFARHGGRAKAPWAGRS